MQGITLLLSAAPHCTQEPSSASTSADDEVELTLLLVWFHLHSSLRPGKGPPKRGQEGYHMDSILKHPIRPRLCLPKEDLLHRCVLVECVEEHKPHLSRHDGRCDLRRGAHNSSCPGRVSCLPLPPRHARGQLKGGKQRGGTKSQAKALLKIGHHPALPCSGPPPAPQRLPATSAQPPFREELVDLEQETGAPVSGGVLHTRGAAGAVLRGRALPHTGER